MVTGRGVGLRHERGQEGNSKIRPVFEGKLQQRVGTMKIQLPGDVFSMSLDSFVAHGDFFGNLFVREIVGNQRENPALRRSQLIDPLWPGIDPMAAPPKKVV